MNVWNVVDSIAFKKRVDISDVDQKIGFVLMKHFSLDNKSIGVVDKLAKRFWIYNDYLVYEYFFDMIPKGKKFLKWPKKINDKNKENGIQEIIEELNVGKNEAIGIYNQYKLLKEI